MIEQSDLVNSPNDIAVQRLCYLHRNDNGEKADLIMRRARGLECVRDRVHARVRECVRGRVHAVIVFVFMLVLVFMFMTVFMM